MKSLLLLSLISVLALGCSSQTSGRSTFASQDSTPVLPPPTGGGTTTATLTDFGGTYSSAAGNIHFRVKTILDAFGNPNPSSVRVRFNATPTGFDSSDEVLINFYVMGVSPTGQPVYPSNPWRPARVRFENPSTGQALCPEAGTSSCFFGWDSAAANGAGANFPINRTALQSIATRSGLPATLSSYNIVVTGADQIYQVLRVAVTTPSGIPYADVLIPRYEANPNVYVATRHALLHSFHPLISETALGLTSEQYRQRINSLFGF